LEGKIGEWSIRRNLRRYSEHARIGAEELIVIVKIDISLINCQEHRHIVLAFVFRLAAVDSGSVHELPARDKRRTDSAIPSNRAAICLNSKLKSNVLTVIVLPPIVNAQSGMNASSVLA